MVTSKEFQELMRQAREREFYNSLYESLAAKSPAKIARAKKECFLDFFNFISSDGFHRNMEGVYHEEGFKIATDARILVMAKADYEKRLEGVILSKELIPINADYPTYKRVLPDFSKMHEISFDFERATKDMREAKEFIRIAKKLRRGDLIPYQMPNGGYVSKANLERIIEFISCYPDARAFAFDDKAKMLAFVSGDLENYEALLLVMPCVGEGGRFAYKNFQFVPTEEKELEKLLLKIGKKEILSRLKFGTTTKNDQKIIDACLEFISYSIGQKVA